MSLQPQINVKSTKNESNIRDIDVHRINQAEAFIRYRSHQTLGLESVALARLKRENVLNKLSPPKSSILYKSFLYVFGGFNSLMWLAMILSFISYEPLGGDNPQVFNLGVAVLLLLVILVSSIFYWLVDFNASNSNHLVLIILQVKQ